MKGFPGCAHDQRVYDNSPLNLDSSRFFENSELLIADSGYACSRTIVPCFKKPHGAALSADQQRFNKVMSKLRVCNENCIGMLKMRFQPLKKLRIVLQG